MIVVRSLDWVIVVPHELVVVPLKMLAQHGDEESGSVMVRADDGALGEPSHLVCALSCKAPVRGSMIRTPRSRSALSRCSPVSSPQRHPVHAAMMMSRLAVSPPMGWWG
ncbi:hypothetical protein UK23_10735 [Lentzea aerocolonigenes]|uniref:Uncharacterized protein n=1 Tax=Lentzea aerocolonigenes TaxID=68170 RepID=A0A0F0H820_LENAE|nr:hypothetical protein UK23_10735 [Lentzea aerocolonigenes]